MRIKVKYAVSIFMTVIMLCGLSGCGSNDESAQTSDVVEVQEITQSAESENLSEAASGEDLDVVAPDPADDDWYMKGNIYTDDNGRRLEVFFNDEGMIEFAIDGLSVYFTNVGTCQFENNWRIYTCDDGTMIVYYPGEPAHIEIYDGDYAGLYEEGGDKVN